MLIRIPLGDSQSLRGLYVAFVFQQVGSCWGIPQNEKPGTNLS